MEKDLLSSQDIMSKTWYSKAEIEACGRGELFNGRIKLPSGNMSVIDRVVSIKENGGKYGKGEIVAEFDIHPDLWFFDCHFVGDPIMPGCLGLDALWQLTGFYLGWAGESGKGRALGVKDLKFKEAILPTTKKVVYRIDIKKINKRGMVIALSDGYVEVDGEIVYEAKDLKIGLF